MKEEIEKLNIEEGEKTTIEKLQAIKDEEIKSKQRDSSYNTLWAFIEIDNLTEESIKLFETLKERPLAARSAYQDLVLKVEMMKESDKKTSNGKFLSWIDDEIAKAFQTHINNSLN